jgi:short-subunit dehydrogenase
MSPSCRLLITGASSGFGLEIALEALKRGHGVIGTARNIEKAQQRAPQFKSAGGVWIELDVTKEDASDIVSKCVHDQYIDILVNNAGYGLYGVFEDMRSVVLELSPCSIFETHLSTSEKEIRAQFETNVFGAMRVIQATIPAFREKRKGVIINMGSISGLTVTTPGGIM